MLDRVKTEWIDGVLDQSLYQTVLMSLGMTYRDAVPRPGSLYRRRPNEQERPVPINVPSILIFEEARQSLLILGEPGAGKTTVMLDLSGSLLEHAKGDETIPIPVVFNLSSFVVVEQSLDDWLVGNPAAMLCRRNLPATGLPTTNLPCCSMVWMRCASNIVLSSWQS